jgi:hypothetical protein
VRFAVRAMRSLLAEPEAPAPGTAWRMAADEVRTELDRRERLGGVPEPLAGLSTDAVAVIVFLHGLEHGRTYVERLRERIAAEPVAIDLWAALDELVSHGLLKVEMAVDEEGWPVEPIVELRYDAKVPDPPGEEAG